MNTDFCFKQTKHQQLIDFITQLLLGELVIQSLLKNPLAPAKYQHLLQRPMLKALDSRRKISYL
jgi:hypothetical protein